MAFGGQRGTLSSALASITASNAVTTGGPITVAVGDLVYVVCAEQTGNTTTAVSDNLGNGSNSTYTALASTLSTVSGRAFYARVTRAGSLTTVTTTATASANDAVIIAVVIEGPFNGPDPTDAFPNNLTTGTTSPYSCPATGTLVQANEVVMAWGVANYGTVWTATSPNLLSLDLASSTNVKLAVGHQTVAVTTTVTPVFAAAGNPTAIVKGTTSFRRDTSLQTAGPFGQVSQLDWELPPRKPDRRMIGLDWQQGALILPLGTTPADTTHILRAPTYAPRTVLPFHRYIQKWNDNLSASAPPGPTSATASASGTGSAVSVGASVDASKILRAPTVTPSWRQRYRIENLGWIALPPPIVTVSASTGSASGTGAASAVGTGINSSTASAAGTGTASGVGAATAASTASASGTGAALGVGTGINASVASAAGVGAASATGASTAASTASAAGTGTATGVSDAAATVAPRVPLYTPTWRRWRLENLGWTDFLTVQIIPPEGNQKNWPNPRGPQWPISLRTFVGGRIGAAVAAGQGIGSAAGTGTASGVGASTAASTASASGTGTATATGTGINASVATAAGVGAASGVGASTAASTASASGTGTATGVGTTALGSVGSASGTGAATATGASTASSTASASGVGTATGVGADAGGFVAGTGSAAGVGIATGAGGAIIAAVGNAAGTGTANGQSPSLAPPPGGAGFVHTFTRKRWRELQLLIAAEQAARAKAERLTTPAKKAPLLEAAAAAQEAIAAAQIEGENARLDALLVRNAATLRNAIRANTQSKLTQQAASAVKQSQTIAARNEDDEDMISILLLL